MARSTSYSCPSCNALNTSILDEPILLLCKNCNSIVFDKIIGYSKPTPTQVPADWTFLQLDTTGEYQNQIFTLVGRLRLQLRNDYKNIWCGAFLDGKNIWLMESYASFAILNPTWNVFDQDVRHLGAGKLVKIKKDLNLRGEYVEKCESISYEGEIGKWKLFQPDFFFIQASNNKNQTAVFTIEGKKIEYLFGEKIEVEKLNLKNVILWNEWK